MIPNTIVALDRFACYLNRNCERNSLVSFYFPFYWYIRQLLFYPIPDFHANIWLFFQDRAARHSDPGGHVRLILQYLFWDSHWTFPFLRPTTGRNFTFKIYCLLDRLWRKQKIMFIDIYIELHFLYSSSYSIACVIIFHFIYPLVGLRREQLISSWKIWRRSVSRRFTKVMKTFTSGLHSRN